MKDTSLRMDYSSYTCPIHKAVTLIGDKWTLFIIREFMYGKEKQGFNDLLSRLRPISSRTLALKLKKLRQNQVVQRTIVQEKPLKVHYSLTLWGKQLHPVLKAIAIWFKRQES